MNYNPYAPPQANPPGGSGPMVYRGAGPQPWEIGEVLSAAFAAFKPNWVVLIFAPAVAYFIAFVPAMICTMPGALRIVHHNSAADVGLRLIGEVITLVVLSFFIPGVLRILLGVARGRTPAFGELFGGGDRFIPMLGTVFLLSVVTTISLFMLVIPLFIVGTGLSLTYFLVVDQGLGPIEAMKASWAATDGQKMKIFVFGIVCTLIAVGAEIACCLPLLVALPVVMLAYTIVFLRITGGGAAPAPAAGFGGPGGYGPGGGGPGYGPPGGGQGYGPPGGGPGYGPPAGGGGYGPPGGGGYGPQGGQGPGGY